MCTKWCWKKHVQILWFPVVLAVLKYEHTFPPSSLHKIYNPLWAKHSAFDWNDNMWWIVTRHKSQPSCMAGSMIREGGPAPLSQVCKCTWYITGTFPTCIPISTFVGEDHSYCKLKNNMNGKAHILLLYSWAYMHEQMVVCMCIYLHCMMWTSLPSPVHSLTLLSNDPVTTLHKYTQHTLMPTAWGHLLQRTSP